MSKSEQEILDGIKEFLVEKSIRKAALRLSDENASDNEKRQAEKDLLKEADRDDEIHRHEANKRKREEQLNLIKWLKWTIHMWLGSVLFVVFLSSVFDYSDAVVITLLSTTTINVLGLFIIALNWLYPKSDGITKF